MLVVTTAPLPADLAALLGPGFTVETPGGGARIAPRGAVLARLPQAFALVPIPSFTVDTALLDAAPALRLVAGYAVGTDNIDIAACTRRGTLVTNTPGVLTDSTADLTMALLLAVARRIPWGDRVVRSGDWVGFEPTLGLGLDLEGTTLGIVGLGRIGAAVAARARGFGMQILYTNPSARPEAEAALGLRRVTLDELLERSEVVSLHCPLTAETRNLLSAERIARLRRGALVINTARGALVDEEALARALRDERLGGVGLDVFTAEPDVHPALRAAPNTVFLPHLGSATRGARTRMVELCAEAIRAVAQRRVPPHALNPEAAKSEERGS